MERAVHPGLAKRIVNSHPRVRSVLGHQNAMILIQNARHGFGKETPAAGQRNDQRILAECGNAVNVGVDASGWID